MKFKYRVCLLGTLLLLSVSTICLWLEYKTLYSRHHPSAERGEEHRSFVKLSNYTSDLVFQPHLRNRPHYKLVVVSLSAAAYYKRRSAVRSTWHTRLKSWNFNRAFDQARAIHFFICFTPRKSRVKDDLELEAEQNGDIVIFADQDKYSQLPVQTLTALDWAHSQFTFDFLLKTDDDSLVNIDEVMRQLEGKSRDMFGGRVYRHRHPGNEQEKQWVAKYHDGISEEYREFAPGAGYILGWDLLARVLAHSSDVELTSAEDVYMGEVVGQLGVPITPLEGVYPIWQEFCNQSEEGSLPHWTIIHWLDPPRMVRFWERLNKNVAGCTKVDRTRAEQQTKKGTFSRN